jgi:hypothetical protein
LPDDLTGLDKIHYLEQIPENLTKKQKKRLQQRQRQITELENQKSSAVVWNSNSQQLYAGFMSGCIGSWAP